MLEIRHMKNGQVKAMFSHETVYFSAKGDSTREALRNLYDLAYEIVTEAKHFSYSNPFYSPDVEDQYREQAYKALSVIKEHKEFEVTPTKE